MPLGAEGLDFVIILVSIRTRPESRVMPTVPVVPLGTPEFQSAPGPKAG